MAGFALVVLFVLIVAFMRGGEAQRLLDLHAFVVVVGGTLVASAFAYPVAVFLRIPSLIIIALTREEIHLPTVVRDLVKASDRVRQHGRQAAPGSPQDIDDQFLLQGLQMVGEGLEPVEIRTLMEAELSAMRGRHRQGIGLFEGMGGFAPTFGILGTVEAMVAVLGNLTNPDKIGLDIALAMVATLYGVGLANLICIPIANRLRKLSEEELRVRQVIVEVLINIQEGAKPDFVRKRLRLALPPEMRRTLSALHERRIRRSQAAQPAAAAAAVPAYSDEPAYDDNYDPYAAEPESDQEIY
ncbi:MAG: MotA/TolQ/ExbB proton channel family protein [Candidatus Sericytochromatia bacterium]|nr:MotA/TolQ/ExbB proton channel family protein [Candidatus Sericytochromatia bacterium]